MRSCIINEFWPNVDSFVDFFAIRFVSLTHWATDGAYTIPSTGDCGQHSRTIRCTHLGVLGAMTRTRTIPRFLHQLQVAVHQRVSEDGTAVEIYERVYTAVDARKNVGYHSAQQIPPPLVVSLEPDQQIGVVIVDQDEREMRHPTNHPARKHLHQSFCKIFRIFGTTCRIEIILPPRWVNFLRSTLTWWCACS